MSAGGFSGGLDAFDDAVGWRGAFAVAGASSLVVALIAFLLLPSSSGAIDPRDQRTGGGRLRRRLRLEGGRRPTRGDGRALRGGFYHWRLGYSLSASKLAGNDVGSGYALVVGVFGLCRRCWRRGGRRPRARAPGTKDAAPGPRAGGRFRLRRRSSPRCRRRPMVLRSRCSPRSFWWRSAGSADDGAPAARAVPGGPRRGAGRFTALTLVGGLAPLAVGAAVDRSDGPRARAGRGRRRGGSGVVVLAVLVAAGLLDGQEIQVGFFRAGFYLSWWGRRRRRPGGGPCGPCTGAGAAAEVVEDALHRAARVGLDGDEAGCARRTARRASQGSKAG